MLEWDETIDGRPPTGGKRKTARTLKDGWVKELVAKAKASGKTTVGDVTTDIWFYFADVNGKKYGDLDNYAHVILNALQHSSAGKLLRNDRDIRDLLLHRRDVSDEGKQKVRIRLRWCE